MMKYSTLPIGVGKALNVWGKKIALKITICAS